MTVEELRAALAQFPDDAEVAGRYERAGHVSGEWISVTPGPFEPYYDADDEVCIIVFDN